MCVLTDPSSGYAGVIMEKWRDAVVKGMVMRGSVRAECWKRCKRQTKHAALSQFFFFHMMRFSYGCCVHVQEAWSSPCSNVIILSSPAPVLIWEAIHLEILVWSDRRDSTKILRVWKSTEGGQGCLKHSLFCVDVIQQGFYSKWRYLYLNLSIATERCVGYCGWQV